MGLRGRGLAVRPFEVLQAMEREAQTQFRAKEQELLQRIEETNAKILALQKEEKDSGVILTGAQQEEIDKFRTQMLDLRKELRDVQHALRQDVDRLGAWLKAINIWAVPLLLGLAAIVLAALRRWRAARFQAAAAR